MEVNFSFNISPYLYKKNPESSIMGREIVSQSIVLIDEQGIENFTFRKLAHHTHHTEATIYRYFENKQKLFLYIVGWYWCYLDFLIDYKIQNLEHPEKKILEIISILSNNLATPHLTTYYSIGKINTIVIREGNKVYMNTHISEINKIQLYKPYKDLCTKISDIFKDYNPHYPFSNFLASTLLETSHLQTFFSENLPTLTNETPLNKDLYIQSFLTDFIFKSLK